MNETTTNRLRTRLHEVAGMLFIGFGVVVLLTNLASTPVYDHFEAVTLQQVEGIEPVKSSPLFLGPLALVMLFPACAAMAAGYAITRRYVPRKTTLAIGLMAAEILVESILIGWLILSGDLPVLIPSAAWGILIACWLRYLFGPVGSLCIPGALWYLCRRSKRGLRKTRFEFPIPPNPAFRPR